MYRKSAVIDAGSYKPMLWFEDYYLWARILKKGSKFYNIQYPLVNMRTGSNLYQRRRDWNYLYQELKFQKILFTMGFINLAQYLKNISIRSSIRIIPNQWRGIIYKIIHK